MKRLSALVILSALAIALPSLVAEENTAITVLNPGFESPVLPCQAGLTCDTTKVPDWLPSGFTGTIKPGAAQYPSGVPGGSNVAFLGQPGTSTGAISQVTGAVVQANTKYTLTLYVGHRADEAFGGYVAALTAGGVTLAYDNTLAPTAGTFLQDVIVYNAGANPSLLGLPVTISIQSVGSGQINIDNVSLTTAQ
jgi:hypothetical protein